MNFFEYIKMIEKVDKLMARCLIGYLKKNDLFEQFKFNADNYPRLNIPVRITECRQFFGWAFEHKSTPEGSKFWDRAIQKWVNTVEEINYDGRGHVKPFLVDDVLGWDIELDI